MKIGCRFLRKILIVSVNVLVEELIVFSFCNLIDMEADTCVQPDQYAYIYRKEMWQLVKTAILAESRITYQISLWQVILIE